MSGDRPEVESEVVLPGGMELVVPPRARDEEESPDHAAHRGAPGRSRRGGPAGLRPLVPGGGPRAAQAT
jgi:hypothetical protein